jgi:hypothetical protein
LWKKPQHSLITIFIIAIKPAHTSAPKWHLILHSLPFFCEQRLIENIYIDKIYRFSTHGLQQSRNTQWSNKYPKNLKNDSVWSPVSENQEGDHWKNHTPAHNYCSPVLIIRWSIRSILDKEILWRPLSSEQSFTAAKRASWTLPFLHATRAPNSKDIIVCTTKVLFSNVYDISIVFMHNSSNVNFCPFKAIYEARFYPPKITNRCTTKVSIKQATSMADSCD